MTARKTNPARMAPVREWDCFQVFARIQRPATGRKMSREVLQSAMSAQRKPKSTQRRVCPTRSDAGESPMPAMRRARTIVQVKRAVVTVISQTQRTAYCMAAGESAHIHADQIGRA